MIENYLEVARTCFTNGNYEGAQAAALIVIAERLEQPPLSAKAARALVHQERADLVAEVDRLRHELAEATAVDPTKRCTCGTPETLGIVHRDGPPCYVPIPDEAGDWLNRYEEERTLRLEVEGERNELAAIVQGADHTAAKYYRRMRDALTLANQAEAQRDELRLELDAAKDTLDQLTDEVGRSQIRTRPRRNHRQDPR